MVHIISGLSQGGAEAMLEKLVYAGRRLDPDIEQSVIVLGSLGVVGERMRNSGIGVTALEMHSSARLLSALPRLVTALRAPHHDVVVQTWLWHADLLGGACARMAGNRRIFWNLRNSMPGQISLKASSTAVARICALVSGWMPAAIVCNSRAAITSHASIGYRTEKCVLIPNGFDARTIGRDESARRALRTAWGISDSEIVVGMVARVDPLKDHGNFINAAAIVAMSHPEVRFALIGDGSTTSVSIHEEIDRHALAERFVLMERQLNVAAVMSALDVFCLSSCSEGFPNVLGEAMLCGTPCVSTDAGDARAIIGDDRRIAPVRDPERLARCLSDVLAMSPSERSSEGYRQRRRIDERFGIDAIWRRYLDLYLRFPAAEAR